MFLAESFGDPACAVEKSIYSSMIYSWEVRTYVGVGLVGLLHSEALNKPDLS